MSTGASVDPGGGGGGGATTVRWLIFRNRHVPAESRHTRATESVGVACVSEPPPNARKAIGSLIEPVTLNSVDADGIYHLAVRMIFKDSLFKSGVRVTPQGVVTMENEELVVEDIPVLDDVLG